MECVTAIPDWYNESNFAAAREQVPNPDYRMFTLAQLQKALEHDAKSADYYRHTVVE